MTTLLSRTDFIYNTYEWGRAKGIHEHSSLLGQTLKTVEELGELAGGIASNRKDKIRDGVGDVLVTLVMVGAQNSVSNVELIRFVERNPNTLLVEPDHTVICGQINFALWNIAEMMGEVVKPHLLLPIAVTPGEITPNIDNIIDAVHNIANAYGLTIEECMTQAWNEIKDRTGYMVVGGAFVKDE